jgi:tetrahydromethanopterin S-methyltransferase subunit E
MADVGPPIALIAVGLILWLAVTATIAGISIQTIGLILFLIGVVWLAIELVTNGRRRTVATRERVVDRPVVREREREVL